MRGQVRRDADRAHGLVRLHLGREVEDPLAGRALAALERVRVVVGGLRQAGGERAAAAVATGHLAVLVAALARRVDALQLAGLLQHQLYPVGALVVHAAPAHLLREVVDHGPRHARQIAQVTMLPLRLHTHRLGLIDLFSHN